MPLHQSRFAGKLGGDDASEGVPCRVRRGASRDRDVGLGRADPVPVHERTGDDHGRAGSSTLAIQTLNLNGIFMKFDESTLALTDFNFQTAPNQWLVLNTMYGGFDQVWINSANVVPGAGYGNLSPRRCRG